MNITKAESELLNRHVHPYKLIERIGRTCYKSEDAINADSASKFVKAMTKNKHYAMLEHGQIYLKVTNDFLKLFESTIEVEDLKYITTADFGEFSVISGSFRGFKELVDKYQSNPAIVVINSVLNKAYPEVFTPIENDGDFYGLTFSAKDNNTAVSVIEEAEIIRKVKTSIAPENRNDILRKLIVHTVKFTCDRGVSHEFVRHRPASFAQESTRYCNYSKDKFGNEIAVIEPCFWTLSEKAELLAIWLDAMQYAEKAYFKLLDLGATPQEARSVLPNSLKTELCITATEDEWQHILNLRFHGVTGAPHPQMVESMKIIAPVLIEASEGRLH